MLRAETIRPERVFGRRPSFEAIFCHAVLNPNRSIRIFVTAERRRTFTDESTSSAESASSPNSMTFCKKPSSRSITYSTKHPTQVGHTARAVCVRAPASSRTEAVAKTNAAQRQMDSPTGQPSNTHSKSKPIMDRRGPA